MAIRLEMHPTWVPNGYQQWANNVCHNSHFDVGEIINWTNTIGIHLHSLGGGGVKMVSCTIRPMHARTKNLKKKNYFR